MSAKYRTYFGTLHIKPLDLREKSFTDHRRRGGARCEHPPTHVHAHVHVSCVHDNIDMCSSLSLVSLHGGLARYRPRAVRRWPVRGGLPPKVPPKTESRLWFYAPA